MFSLPDSFNNSYIDPYVSDILGIITYFEKLLHITNLQTNFLPVFYYKKDVKTYVWFLSVL
jgi:hypothetical protein